jgi:glyoxylase-like metal-dependent hydrolase (beta-lactamase superfamily II)
MMKTVRAWSVALALAICCAPNGASQTAGGDDLEVLRLRPNFYMLAGPSGNIAVQIGEDGIIVVDTGPAARADAVLAATKSVSTRPIRYVIDTSSDSDRVGGNEKIAKAGRTLFIVNNVLGEGMTNGCSGGGKGAGAYELARRADLAVSPRGVADGNLQRLQEVHVPQRRRDRSVASA